MNGHTLEHSRWATNQRVRVTETGTLVITDADKLPRLLTRIRWKAESLLFSWERAINDTSSVGSAADALSTIRGTGATTEKEVQTMFKLDFFEFYVLLERYIVLCLSLCGVKVPRGDPTAIKSDYANGYGGHRYHANVLDTIDKKSCVLHEALGERDTRRYLGLAKEYRNKWKDADEPKSADDTTKARFENLDLPNMLKSLIVGLENAKVVVAEESEKKATSATVRVSKHEKSNERLVDGYNDMDMDDTPYEAVEDGMEMDWEL